MAPTEPLHARAMMRPYALLYFYRRRLRAHAAQELLAGLGVAIAIALVFATIVASSSIAGSAGEVVRTVIGPASLQIRARDSHGLPEGMLARVEHLAGVAQAGPLLEQAATVTAPNGRSLTVDLAGTDTSLVVLDGLAHTLPVSALSPGGVGLSKTTAGDLDIPRPASGGPTATGASPQVTLQLRGAAIPMKISAVLGPETFGALSSAQVAVMPLADLQRLAGLRGQITRVLVATKPGAQGRVRSELEGLSGGRFTVQAANADLGLLKQALRPSDQASGFFAAISALLGFLLAFNALLLTVPERRQAIADLRLIGTKRSAIVQMFVFQTVLLGLAASLLGILGGYALAHGVLHQSTGYLEEAFTLGSSTTLSTRPLLLSLAGGILATSLASAVPLLDLRRGRVLDAVYLQDGVPGNSLSGSAQRRLGSAAACLLAFTILLFVLEPALALLACALLALATVLVVPLALALVLRLARALARAQESLTILPVALTSLRATSLRSLALAGTGAVALFGSVALGGSRADLVRGIRSFAHSYSADANIWVTNPGDNQATIDFRTHNYATRIARLPGVAQVSAFQGGFLQVAGRRVWIIARPPGADANVLRGQISAGDADTAIRRLGERGWVAVSKQIAEEHHTGVGGNIMLPTPTGSARFQIAATTTNLAWSPGVIFMSTADYGRLWATSAPTALGVRLKEGVDVHAERRAIAAALGPASGLEVSVASAREASIDRLTEEGLSQLEEISTLLLVAAILAMSAALTSAIWQRRVSLAGLRLSGVRSHRLRRVLLIESSLMLSAGCVTGALAGIYGQLIIDGYLAHVTGFPVSRLGTSLRPLEILALVVVFVLAIVTIPGWLASRVSPTLALNE
jgi:putative ABC transport system permease protein